MKLFQNKLLASILALLAILLIAGQVNAAYIHNDISGSPLAATDASGKLLWKENYRPYGERVIDANAATASNSLWFAGKPQDARTGLSYMGARYYNPVLGRFMGVDPKEVEPGNLHSFNRYAYANNNPYKYVDPDGHAATLVEVGVVLLGVGSAVWIDQHREQIQRDANRVREKVHNWIFNESDENSNSGKAEPSAGGAGQSEANGADGKGQKDATKRPSRVRKGTEQANWDNAADGENGGKLCPTCDKEVTSKPGTKNKDWDNDHNPAWRDRDLSGKDRKGVLDEYNRDTRLRCIGCNRSDNGN